MNLVRLRGTGLPSAEALVAAVASALAPPSVRVEWDRMPPAKALQEFEARVLAPERRRATKNKDRVLAVVIDEIDALVAVAADATRRLFALAAKQDLGLALVGIANAIDLPQRSLAARPHDTVVFEPYAFAQLTDILQARTGDVFDAKAVEFAARKVAAHSGDARKAIDVCLKALRLAHDDHVTIAHVLAVFKDAAPDPLQMALKGLPPNARLALNTALRLRSTTFTHKDLVQAYYESQPGLSRDAAADEAVHVLVAVGLIAHDDAAASGPLRPITNKRSKKRSSNPSHRALRLAVDAQHVRDALASS